MKFLSVILLIWMFNACSLIKRNSSSSVIKNSVPEEMTHTGFVSGLVSFVDGCGYYIQVKEGGEIKKYYPFNLTDEYKKEGVKIHFLFHLSRAKQPEGCKVDAVIVVDEIEYEI